MVVDGCGLPTTVWWRRGRWPVLTKKEFVRSLDSAALLLK